MIMHLKLNYTLAYISLLESGICAATKSWFVLGDMPIARRGMHVVFSAKSRFFKIGESYSDHGASICYVITVCMLFATNDGV